MGKTILFITKDKAINDYLGGMSYRAVAKKYNVDHKTVRYWVLRSGNTSRGRIDAVRLACKEFRGVRRSKSTEFKKENVPWNKDTEGVMKKNKTSFKKGERVSPVTEFKRGNVPWNNGTASEGEYSLDFNICLKEAIRCRDNHICKLCGCSQVFTERLLDCHHIDYNKKNCEETNLISLCRSCHSRTNFNRTYWKKYFKEIV